MSNNGIPGRPTTGSAVAALAVVLTLLSGTALVAGAQTQGGTTLAAYSSVSCSVDSSSITVSWQGERRAYRYEAWVRHTSGWKSGKGVDWSSRGAEAASAEFTSLAAGTYDVWVDMQTVDGSFFLVGETTCTVTATTTTTTAPPTTTTTAPPDSPGTLSCSADSSSVTVSLDAADGTTSWQSWLEHSSGYPRVGQYLFLDGTPGQLSHKYDQVTEGLYHVTGTAFFGTDSQRALPQVSCTVVAAPPGTTSNSWPTGAPTISGTAQVSQILTADTSGIADADGLTNATFSYQWLVSSPEAYIVGATNSTYTVQEWDVGWRIKVRVTFTDDAGNEEAMTSAATSVVGAGGL